MTVDAFISELINHGWQVKLRDKPSFSSNVLQTRDGSIPDSYKEFLSKVADCQNSDNDIWFLCEDDFEGKSDSAFVWNEFELLSLEAAGNDESLIVPIKDFWRVHLPIVFSVKDCYEYLAISLNEGEKGIIVKSFEPYFEEADKVADSFDELMNKIIDKLGSNETFRLINLR